MDQRDLAFLADMTDFICMNRLATVFALLQAAIEPDSIAKFTVQQLYINISEPLLHELTEKNTGNI